MASDTTEYGMPHVIGVTSIDAKVVGNTALLVSEPDGSVRHFVILGLLAGMNLSGVVAGPTISMGTNSPNFDNIMAPAVAPAGLTGSIFIQPLNTNPLVQNGAAV